MKNHQPDVHDGLGRNVLNLMNLQVETPEEFGFKKAEVFTAKNSITEQAASWKDRPFILGSDIFQFFQGALFARFFGGGGHFFSAFSRGFSCPFGDSTHLFVGPSTHLLSLSIFSPNHQDPDVHVFSLWFPDPLSFLCLFQGIDWYMKLDLLRNDSAVWLQ